MAKKFVVNVTTADVEMPVISGERVETCKNLAGFFDQLASGNLATTTTILASNTGTCASGTIVISDTGLSNDDAVKIGTVTLTAKASPANENQFVTGATEQAGATNLAAAINAHSTLSKVVSAVATSDATTGTVTVTVLLPGEVGNQLVMAETVDAGNKIAVTSFANGAETQVALTLA